MAKPGRLPDFWKMYPKASEEVIEVLRKTERKMQYQEWDAERYFTDATDVRRVAGKPPEPGLRETHL